jgi:hypothetical protein
METLPASGSRRFYQSNAGSLAFARNGTAFRVVWRAFSFGAAGARALGRLTHHAGK